MRSVNLLLKRLKINYRNSKLQSKALDRRIALNPRLANIGAIKIQLTEPWVDINSVFLGIKRQLRRSGGAQRHKRRCLSSTHPYKSIVHAEATSLEEVSRWFCVGVLE